MAPRTASARPNKTSQPPRDTFQGGPNIQYSFIFHRFLKDLGVLAVSASRLSKTAQEAPKMATKRSAGPPLGLQDGPKGLQDSPISSQDGSKRGPRRGTRTDIASLRPREAPRKPQDAPRSCLLYTSDAADDTPC
eukprot:2345317-Pyramimonas_sp.AAC.1